METCSGVDNLKVNWLQLDWPCLDGSNESVVEISGQSKNDVFDGCVLGYDLRWLNL